MEVRPAKNPLHCEAVIQNSAEDYLIDCGLSGSAKLQALVLHHKFRRKSTRTQPEAYPRTVALTSRQLGFLIQCLTNEEAMQWDSFPVIGKTVTAQELSFREVRIGMLNGIETYLQNQPSVANS